MDARLLDKVQGCLIGVALGDALGSTWEFSTKHELATSAKRDQVGRMLGGGGFGWRPGQGTDDTDQTAAVARGLLRAVEGSGRLATGEAVERILDELLAWWNSRPLDVGCTTGRALAHRAQYRFGEALPEACERSLANGSLMRTAPIGVAVPADHVRIVLAGAVSALTHSNVQVTTICQAYCSLVSDLVAGRRWRDTYRDRVSSDPELIVYSDEGDGTAVRAWLLALWAVERKAASPFQRLLGVIREGGDTDTNAAIAGGLVGARWGLAGWPERLVNQLEYRDELMRLGVQLTALRQGLAATVAARGR